MHGQTPSAYKILARAYRSLLRRMWLKNTTFTVALTAGVISGGAGVAHADENDGDIPVVENNQHVSPGPDGTYSNIHPVDTNGIFAGPAQSDTRPGIRHPLTTRNHKVTKSNQ